MNTFTASQKQFIFDALTKVKRDEENLHLAYKNVYNILNEACACRIPSDDILPNKDDLLNFVEERMKDSASNAKLHARLIQVMEYLQPVTAEQRLRSRLLQVLNDPDDGDEYLRGRHHQYGDELVEESKAAIASSRKRSYQSRRSPSPSVHSQCDDESYAKKKEIYRRVVHLHIVKYLMYCICCLFYVYDCISFVTNLTSLARVGTLK